jgi:hypothetical protein
MSVRPSRRPRLTLVALGVAALSLAGGGVAQANQPGVTATFSITKKAVPADTGTSFKFHWVDLTDPSQKGDFELKHGETRSFAVGRGLYRVTEQTLAGWTVSDITCTSTDDEYTTDVKRGRVDIELSPDEQKSCTFTNTKPTTPVSPYTPPTPPTPPVVTPPEKQILPVTFRNAAARMIKPSKCVSRRYSVAVRGGPVTRVAFSVNGRRVKTLKARKGQRRFTVKLAAPRRVALVTARVSFASDARPASKTLRATIRRCARAAVAPKFTG